MLSMFFSFSMSDMHDRVFSQSTEYLFSLHPTMLDMLKKLIHMHHLHISLQLKRN